MSLIECVPNFSEGRRDSVIDTIVSAIQSEDIYLLDVSSDADHNRTVVTFAGEPEPVLDACLRGMQMAAETIDLNQHEGVHPRIGATDVVPLIPLRDIDLKACATLAAELGERVGAELKLPVYLYEAAARRPERRNLANIRRGQYEYLRDHIGTDPEHTPDFGPAQVGPAGAVAIGARNPLIAFNAYLNTTDVTIADRIARNMRESSGGLPYVKALGLLVRGRAQVSMNVIDYRQTGLSTIMQQLNTEAARQGVTVIETELVGLAPQAALFDAALACLKLPPPARNQVLEHRLGSVQGDYRELPFE